MQAITNRRLFPPGVRVWCDECGGELNGIYLGQLSVGDVVRLRTAHSTYLLTVVEKDRGVVAVQGNGEYLREPQLCFLNGSTFGGSCIKLEWIGVSMCLELETFSQEKITTSPVQWYVVENDSAKAYELFEAAERHAREGRQGLG